MSLSFERKLAPPARSACVAMAMLALAAAGAVLGVVYGWQRWGWPMAAALAGGCAAVLVAGVRVAWSSIRLAGGDPGAMPVLRVDAMGRASLRWQGRDIACTARHWLLADRWVALCLDIDDSAARRGRRRLDILSGGADGDDTWRRLRVWLTWLQRGALPEGVFDPVAASRKPLEFPTSIASHRSP